jgi:hypothetical protein
VDVRFFLAILKTILGILDQRFAVNIRFYSQLLKKMLGMLSFGLQEGVVPNKHDVHCTSRFW